MNSSGVDPSGGRVDGELADGDRDASHPPVADTENLFGVGGDDQVDIVGAGTEILESDVDTVGVINTQVDTPRALEFLAVAFDRLPHRGRVDDR